MLNKRGHQKYLWYGFFLIEKKTNKNKQKKTFISNKRSLPPSFDFTLFIDNTKLILDNNFVFFLPFKTPWKFPFFLIHHFEKCNFLFHVWTSELFKPYLRNFKKRPNNWRNYFRDDQPISFKKISCTNRKKRRKKKSHSISDKKKKTKKKKKEREKVIILFPFSKFALI